MKRKVLSMTAMLAVSSLFIGCSAATSTKRVDFTPVTVRFVMPPEPDALADASVQSGARLATDGSYDGFADPNDTTSPASDVYHVALWGDAFSGHDVTRGVTMLKPGAYTFAFLDRDKGDMMQGWLEVNQERDNLLDFLRTWKSQIPQQKRQFAYDYEIRSQEYRSDPAAIEGFQKQLDALNRVEKQLDNMIRAEMSGRDKWRQQSHHLFQNAEFRILPGGEPVFHPATRAAFNDTDMATVREGDPVSKFVLLADHEEAQWKLNRVNQLYSDLKHCRAVMQEAANRFERQKGLYLLTDHLHPNDSRFVENEIRLQNTLGIVERLDEQLADLRHRRLALAFVAGLVSPKDHFRALNTEEKDLTRERVVLDTEVRRLDLLVEKSDPSLIKRVNLEQTRQRVQAALHNIDQHIEDLWAAHRSLETMITSKAIIHRQGDQRLLAATLVGGGLPYPVRQAVESESVMTVRLEKSDSVYLPSEMGPEGSVTRGQQPIPFRPDKVAEGKTKPQPKHSGTAPAAKRTTSAYRGQPASYPQNVYSHKTKAGSKKPAEYRPHKTVTVKQPKVQRDGTVRDKAPKVADKKGKGPWKDHAQAKKTRKVSFRNFNKGKIRKAHPVRKPGMHQKHAVRSSGQPKTSTQAKMPTTHQPQVTERQPTVTDRRDWVTPPDKTTTPKKTTYAKRTTDRREWSSPPPKPRPEPEPPAQFARQPFTPKRRAQRVADTTPQKVQKSGCDLPWFVQVFVPPCWFVGSIKPEAKVVSYKEPPIASKKQPHYRKTKQRDVKRTHYDDKPTQYDTKRTHYDDKPTQYDTKRTHYDDKPTQYDTKRTQCDDEPTQYNAKRTRYDDKPRQKQVKGCDLPWFIQVFVPPCWFIESQKQTKNASLAKYREPRQQPKEHDKPVARKKEKTTGCENPWLIKVLVPPCWFVD